MTECKLGPLTSEALGLAEEAFVVPIHAKERHVLKDEWSRVAYFHLIQSWRTLGAIHLLVGKGIVDPSGILLRHLFELAVTVRYLDACRKQVAEFVNYYSDSLPKRAWRRTSEMCETLGLLSHYEEMYRLLSERAHGGVLGMGQEYLRLLGHEKMPDWEPAAVLASAAMYYEWVVRVTLEPMNDDWCTRLAALSGAIRKEQRDDLEGRGIL